MRVLLSLAKPRYHLSYAAVIAAALLFAWPFDRLVAVRLAALFVSFNVLFYSGIYIFNDVADAGADAAHPRKRDRPIPAGRISIGHAVTAGTALILAGFSSAALFFSPSVVGAYVAALALNAAYSGGGRNVPYLDVALNSAPHAVRFLMGALIVNRVPPFQHLIAWFCLAAGVACVRRLVELEAGGAGSRPVLRHYSERGLSAAADAGFLLMVGLGALDRLQSPGFYAIAITAYLIGVLVVRRSDHLQRSLSWLWLR
jgi:decaprenyl-phosphate phosphoribosyltransferase